MSHKKDARLILVKVERKKYSCFLKLSSFLVYSSIIKHIIIIRSQKVSGYDLEIHVPHSQTEEQPTAPYGTVRILEEPQNTQVKQPALSLSRKDGCKTRKDTE